MKSFKVTIPPTCDFWLLMAKSEPSNHRRWFPICILSKTVAANIWIHVSLCRSHAFVLLSVFLFLFHAKKMCQNNIGLVSYKTLEQKWTHIVSMKKRVPWNNSPRVSMNMEHRSSRIKCFWFPISIYWNYTFRYSLEFLVVEGIIVLFTRHIA